MRKSRLRRGFGGAALLWVGFGPAAAAAPLQRGDLLVTDHYGKRVLRVDRTGTVETFSPPLGSANLLSGPSGITVVDGGSVYVVDGGRLVVIDRETGEQSVAQRSSGLGPLDVGVGAWGLTHFQRPGELVLYVSSLEGLTVVAPNLDFGGFDGVLLGGPPFGGLGVGVRPTPSGVDVEEVWIGTGADGMWRWRPGPGFDQILTPDPGAEAGESIHDIEFARDGLRAPAFTKVAFLGSGACAPGSGGVFVVAFGVGPISQGGLLRCPLGLALVDSRQEIFVTEADSIGPGGDGRIVRLSSDGSGVWTQSVFVDAATLGVALPADVALVPEPTAGALAVAALGALGALSRRAGRGGRGPGRPWAFPPGNLQES